MGINVRAKTGAGTGIYYGDGASPENFTKFAQILTIKLSGAKQATEKVTNQDSAADVNGVIYQELLGTIADPGMVDFTLNYVPTDATHKALLSYSMDGKVHDFLIKGPTDLTSSPVAPKFTITFSASIFDYPDRDLPLDKAMTLTVKMQIIGTFAIAYSQ